MRNFIVKTFSHQNCAQKMTIGDYDITYRLSDNKHS